jgi:hypothetical protein
MESTVSLQADQLTLEKIPTLHDLESRFRGLTT